jgi:capsule polysaccharide export protein KpsE/RkpR
MSSTEVNQVVTGLPEQQLAMHESAAELEDAGVSLLDLVTWVGQGKRLIGIVTLSGLAVSLGFSLLMTPIYTARTSMLPPGAQQQSSSSAALSALGSLGGLAGGLGGKAPDELYVALLKSDSVVRALDERFDLKQKYKVKAFETLRLTVPKFVRVSSDRKSGVISLEVDDKDPQFAADLANAHAAEVTRLLGRLALSEAQQRRVFFEAQLKETKEKLIKAENELRSMQEKSGVVVLERQADVLLTGAAQMRALIATREVQLKVLRTSGTDRNPDVMRLASEISALRSELARMESAQGRNPGSAVDMPVNKIPEAAVEYIRARRELKLQETILEAMVRQYESAKLDEAKEGPLLQQIDKALPPDFKSKPSRASMVLTATLLALLGSISWVIVRAYMRLRRDALGEQAPAWLAARQAWRLRA